MTLEIMMGQREKEGKKNLRILLIRLDSLNLAEHVSTHL